MDPLVAMVLRCGSLYVERQVSSPQGVRAFLEKGELQFPLIFSWTDSSGNECQRLVLTDKGIEECFARSEGNELSVRSSSVL